MQPRILLCTTGSRREAKKIAETVVKEKLAACCNVVPGIESVYLDAGKVRKGKEALLLCKTTSEKERALAKRITELHSYRVPVLESIDSSFLNLEALVWLAESLAEKREK